MRGIFKWLADWYKTLDGWDETTDWDFDEDDFAEGGEDL
jgi:hypothetical protein